MAKDLPYFKFISSEWNDGDITLEDYETQGLYINICSYYWSNECVVELVKLKKKFKGTDAIIQTLIDSNIIKVSGNFISIHFLDRQLTEREETSKVKSKGGKASAEARRLAKLQQTEHKDLTENQHVLNSCSTESQVLREEEKKKDKNILKDIPEWDEFKSYALEKEPSVNTKALKNKYDAWVVNDWRNGNDKPIKNWKSALLQTLIYIEKNKPQPKSTLGI